MKDVLSWALDLATHKGASYVDARVVDDRSRSLATKNGKVGHASDAESLGIGIRVIADGAWGFAAADDLSRPAVETAAARAFAILAQAVGKPGRPGHGPARKLFRESESSGYDREYYGGTTSGLGRPMIVDQKTVAPLRSGGNIADEDGRPMS